MQSSRSFTLPRPPFSGLFAQHQCVRVTGRVYEYNKKICGKNIKCATRSFYYPTAAHRHTETPWSPHPLSRTSGSKLTGDGHWSNCCQCLCTLLPHSSRSLSHTYLCVCICLSLSLCLSVSPPLLLLPASSPSSAAAICFQAHFRDRPTLGPAHVEKADKEAKEREGGRG